MANNRMFIVYRPTGDAVYLGKRMSSGWYGTPEDVSERIAALFEKAEKARNEGKGSLDDFAIALEAGEHQPHCIDKWNYTKDTDRIDIDESVPYGTPECL